MKTKYFFILNFLKIITYTFSIIFIFFAFAYGLLLFVALLQYIIYANAFDSCIEGIVLGMVFSSYNFWYYITLACAFGRERRMFIEVGSETDPGLRATYEAFGNMMVKAVIPTQQIFGLSPQMIIQPSNLPYQQTHVYNQPQQNIQINQQPQEQIRQIQEQVQIQEQIQNEQTSKRNVKNDIKNDN